MKATIKKSLIKNIKQELKEAKKSKLSSWIYEVSRKLDKANEFFEVAEKVGLVKDGYYIDGIPKGNKDEVNLFYKLEDYLEYPEPQKI
jgi:hypothetical protein